jgi:ATP-dependent RNA helicase RhlE
MSFESFQLNNDIMTGVRELGYTDPTPIQEQAIPPVMLGRDVIGLAQTGTGKTAAFVLPVLHRLMTGRRGIVRALVVSPTRELAEQTHTAFADLGKFTGLHSAAIYGGVGASQQNRILQSGVDIIVACPGRLVDFLWQGTIDLSKLEILVIDEADRMFDMGFLPDIRNILNCIMNKRQTLLFSATMPPVIRKLVNEILDNPVTVQIGTTRPATTVSHVFFPVAQQRKPALLKELLRKTETDSVLVFTRTKHGAERIAGQLKQSGFHVAALQGNMSQYERQAALDDFRSGQAKILVATDIAARGIDVLTISHVINYDMPDEIDAYTHRIGRTGRIGKTGEAFTLVTAEDNAMIRDIEKLLNTKIERRTLEGFDYTAPEVKPVIKRPQRQFSRMPGQMPTRRREPAANRR